MISFQMQIPTIKNRFLEKICWNISSNTIWNIILWNGFV